MKFLGDMRHNFQWVMEWGNPTWLLHDEVGVRFLKTGVLL